MANRRAPANKRKPKKDDAAPKSKLTSLKLKGPWHEAIAVALGCIGLLTLLALVSFDPRDASLNASGTGAAHNWIGPAGAYWADLLLQAMGVGSYALGLGFFFAGWRALTGKRIRPGLRELSGTLLLIVALGAFFHLLLAGQPRPYPPGGVLGAVLAGILVDHFAQVGSFVLSGALVLISLALTADGVLAGLGWRGVDVLVHLGSRLHVAWVLLRERRRRIQEVRASEAAAAPPPATHWTLGDLETAATRRAARQARLERARERGRELGELQVVRARELAEAKALRDVSEPELQIDRTVDLVAEEQFELGELPELGELVAPAPLPDVSDEVIELEPEEVELVTPIRAAQPEPLVVANPVLLEDDEVEELEPVALPTAAKGAGDDTRPDLPLPVDEPKSAVRGRRRRPREPEIVDVRPEVDMAALERAAAEKGEDAPRDFTLPTVSLLDYTAEERAPLDPERMRDNAQKLTKTLKDYGIEGNVREIRPGPVVTMYEYVPGPGVKLSKIAALADDLAMSMEALRVRIVAPIPGKGAVGIEIPNETRETVYLKEIVAHDSFRRAKHKLTLALGKDIEGNAYSVNLAKMPHLLVAGATGAGKSVAINGMIMSILFKSTPDEVRMIMVDPKRLELKVYDDIPHLLLPVVTDPKKASLALRWAVEEMERRYQVLSQVGVRNIDSYNQKVKAAAEGGEALTIPSGVEGQPPQPCKAMPYIVVIVDELADLMMVASREVEASIMRLAQMARAAGIHLILATQRPSVDVITGVIKANFPTRIAFQVASKHDARTIIDQNGAEHLLGRGDMLYLSPGAGGLVRVHGAFVSDEEIERTVDFLKQQARPEYDESILAEREDAGGDAPADEDKDEMYDQAVAIVAETRQASISMIQRRLRIGYNRAARLVEMMEAQGIVGPADGAKPRPILVPPAAY